MGILSWVAVGLIAGFLAGQVMKSRGYGVVGDLIVGVLGGVAGGWIGNAFLHTSTARGMSQGSILISFTGAVLLILLLRMTGGRKNLRDKNR